MEYFEGDGKTLAGFDIDLTRALAGKLGLQVRFIDTAWEGILAGLDTGKYDLAVNITILPERQKKYNFTKPYLASSITLVVLKDTSLNAHKNVRTPEDIAGLRVAYQGDTTAHFFTEKRRETGARFTSYAYDKILHCFDDLRMGRVDVVVVDNIVAYDYAGKENSPFAVVWQGPADEWIGICLKKGNDALTDALDNALDELFDEGTLQGISQKTFKRDIVSGVRSP
jgi:polar amino acid transport system substrate-binding protein